MRTSKIAVSNSIGDLRWRVAGISLVLILIVFTSLAVSTAWSGSGHHRIVTPADLKWEDVPALPKGAKGALIEGPMNQAVPFTIRLKMPANFTIPPHSHPAVERVTVLSGTFNIGLGDKFDKTETKAVEPGSMVIMQPKTNHFAWTENETVVQLNGTGPWDIVYVNPEDDPRKK